MNEYVLHFNDAGYVTPSNQFTQDVKSAKTFPSKYAAKKYGKHLSKKNGKRFQVRTKEDI